MTVLVLTGNKLAFSVTCGETDYMNTIYIIDITVETGVLNVNLEKADSHLIARVSYKVQW